MDQFRRHLDWIDGRHDRMCRLVADWSALNSGSYNVAGLGRCADAILPELDPLGGRIEAVDLPPHRVVDDAGQPAERPLGRLIRATTRPDAAVRVLLGIHYDTVYGPEDPFQRPERADEHTLRGPGVADAKGGIVVMLTALAALERSPFADRIGWDLFLNPDEEVGSPGSGPVIAEMAPGKAAGLVFEPSLPDGALVGERKGSGNFTAVVTGRSTHAGRDPQLGRNAIHALAGFVTAVAAMNDHDAGVTVNVGRIAGGGPVNVVPNLASCRFNVRVKTSDQQRVVERNLNVLTRTINGHNGYTCRLHGGFAAPPKPLDAGLLRLLAVVADSGRALGLDLSWRPSGGVCDGNRLAAAGLPTVDTLGPRGGDLHSSGEYVRLDSLVERAKLTALLLMRIAAGEVLV